MHRSPCADGHIPMITQLILVAVLAFPVPLGGSPWDKPPANWNLSDVSKILLDSPWSPTEVKLEREFTSPITDPQTRLETEAPVNANNPNQIPGIKLSRSKPQPKVPVIWWSSKTIRFAQQRLHQLSDPALAVQPLHVDDLPDYVLVIEASEALRILADAKEDLRDTVFLELASGTTLDLESAVVVEGPAQQTPRIEFHFPRQIDGRATLDPESDRVIFHCKASAKTPRPAHDNSLSLRAEFRPRTMRAHGVPDL